jgi:hypothetical protein
MKLVDWFLDLQTWVQVVVLSAAIGLVLIVVILLRRKGGERGAS